MFNTFGNVYTTIGGGYPVWKRWFDTFTSGATLGVIPTIGTVLPAGTPIAVDVAGGVCMPIEFYKTSAAVIATPAVPAVLGVYALKIDENPVNSDAIAIGGESFEFVTTPATGKVTIAATAALNAAALEALIDDNATLMATYTSSVVDDTIYLTQKVGGTGAMPAVVVTQATGGTGLEAYISTVTVGSAAAAAVTATEIAILAGENYEAPAIGNKIKVLSTGVEFTVSGVSAIESGAITLTVNTITAGIPQNAILYLSELSGVDIDVANLRGMSMDDIYFETGTTAATVDIVTSGTIYADRVPFVPQEVKSYIPNILFEGGI